MYFFALSQAPPPEVIEIALYFDKERRVQRLADYGTKDGNIFDYVSRATPTGGTERSILGPLFTLFK